MPRSRGTNVALWIVSGLLALLYVGASLPKLLGLEQVVADFERFGYSDGFRLFIGAAELAGAIGLLIPRLATWAASGLAIIMAGAVYTHLSVNESFAVPAVILLLLIGVALARRSEALFLAPAPAASEPLPGSERPAV